MRGVVGALVERQREARDLDALVEPARQQALEAGDRGGALRVGLQNVAIGLEGRAGVADARLLDLADAQQQLFARVARSASTSRRRAPTRPAQSWRASSTRVRPRTARSLVALSPIAGAISMIASSVRPAAARSPTFSSSNWAMRNSMLARSATSDGAVGARVQQLGQIGPRLGLGQDLLERRLGLVVAARRLGQDLLGEAARVLRLVEPPHGDAQRTAQQPQPLLGRDLGLAGAPASRRPVNSAASAPHSSASAASRSRSAVTSVSVGASA